MQPTSTLVHIGLTVQCIDTFAAFYETYFGFTVKRRGVFPPEFIASAPTLYALEDGVYANFAFLASPNGIVLELFEFHPQLKAETPVWNRPGYHHLCLKVPSVPEAYERLSKAGVEFYFAPKPLGENPGAHWAFFKDPDGNMVELQDSDL